MCLACFTLFSKVIVIVSQCPQQSPPSKLHSTLFASSLQTPFPIRSSGAEQFKLSKHIHLVQYLVSTLFPQQSPWSKWHFKLLFSSSHIPFPMANWILLSQPIT